MERKRLKSTRNHQKVSHGPFTRRRSLVRVQQSPPESPEIVRFQDFFFLYCPEKVETNFRRFPLTQALTHTGNGTERIGQQRTEEIPSAAAFSVISSAFCRRILACLFVQVT